MKFKIEDATCPICHQTLHLKEILILETACQQFYHRDCLYQTISSDYMTNLPLFAFGEKDRPQKVKCPTCRQPCLLRVFVPKIHSIDPKYIFHPLVKVLDPPQPETMTVANRKQVEEQIFFNTQAQVEEQHFTGLTLNLQMMTQSFEDQCIAHAKKQDELILKIRALEAKLAAEQERSLQMRRCLSLLRFQIMDIVQDSCLTVPNLPRIDAQNVRMAPDEENSEQTPQN